MAINELTPVRVVAMNDLSAHIVEVVEEDLGYEIKEGEKVHYVIEVEHTDGTKTPIIRVQVGPERDDDDDAPA